MIDIVAALAAIRARAEATIAGLPLLFPDEGNVLPDVPAPFAYFELIAERGRPIELGSGRGNNRHRHPAELNIYVFQPRGAGLAAALTRAESVAAQFRSYRGGGISCEGADVHPLGEGEDLAPPGLSSVAGNYSCAVVNVPLIFDQAG